MNTPPKLTRADLALRIARLQASGGHIDNPQQRSNYQTPATALEYVMLMRRWRDSGLKPYAVLLSKLPGWGKAKLRGYLFGGRRYVITNPRPDWAEERELALRSRIKNLEAGCVIVDKGLGACDEDDEIGTATTIADAMVPYEKIDRGNISSLRDQVVIFLSSPQPHRACFERPNDEHPGAFTLSASDLNWFRARLADVQGDFIGMITPTSVRYIKYNEEDEAEYRRTKEPNPLTANIAMPTSIAPALGEPAIDHEQG